MHWPAFKHPTGQGRGSDKQLVLAVPILEGMRLGEGDYPPVYYLPRKDVKMERLIRTSHTTHCPHKGDATYYSLCNGRTARNAVWSYEQPLAQVVAIKEHLAFYPDKVDSIDCS